MTGKDMDRQVYFRAPPELVKAGLVPPGSLLKAVKGLFGVPEAPRLWFLEVIEKAVTSGFERVPGFPCVLVCRDAGKFVGMIALHVDDGVMTGEGPQWDTCVKSLFSKLRLKHHRVNDLEYLKRRIVRRKDGSIDVRFDNVSAIRPIELTKQRRTQQDDAVSAEERTSLRSLLGEMQWPVREGFPEHAYDVSDLQQRVPEATVSTILRATCTLRALQKRVGRAQGPRLDQGRSQEARLGSQRK